MLSFAACACMLFASERILQLLTFLWGTSGTASNDRHHQFAVANSLMLDFARRLFDCTPVSAFATVIAWRSNRTECGKLRATCRCVWLEPDGCLSRECEDRETGGELTRQPPNAPLANAQLHQHAQVMYPPTRPARCKRRCTSVAVGSSVRLSKVGGQPFLVVGHAIYSGWSTTSSFASH
jgi:hypothetical protein